MDYEQFRQEMLTELKRKGTLDKIEAGNKLAGIGEGYRSVLEGLIGRAWDKGIRNPQIAAVLFNNGVLSAYNDAFKPQ